MARITLLTVDGGENQFAPQSTSPWLRVLLFGGSLMKAFATHQAKRDSRLAERGSFGVRKGVPDLNP